MLTQAQYQAIKTNIAASSDMNGLSQDEPGAQAIADLYNAPAVPDFWVFKTSIKEEEITAQPSVDATLFSWTAYIGRSQGERDGWMRLFRNGVANPSLSNVQQAFADIFSGASGSTQRTHILACIRRKATRLEKVMATGTGSTASPGTLTFEGTITLDDVMKARAS